jgi:hypothetical protein
MRLCPRSIMSWLRGMPQYTHVTMPILRAADSRGDAANDSTDGLQEGSSQTR